MKVQKKLYPNGVAHPAVYSNALLPVFASALQTHNAGKRVLDPFAGTGKIHELQAWGYETVGIELEKEWAELRPGNIVGNALKLPFKDEVFDAIVTSPCLEASELVLRADLRWVQAGAVEVGDQLLAFDEHSPGIKANGHKMRRKWRIATVTQAGLKPKRCVRVTMENGDSVVCSWDHPWLTQKYSYGGLAAQWVTARDLKGYYALKQLDVWKPDRSYEAGWLAGMFDGEGSLSFGVHGSPKLMIVQNSGALAEQAEHLLRYLGHKVNVIPRKGTSMVNIYVTDGFPGILRALGELRPTRLIDKLSKLDVASRCIEPRYIKVVDVEDVGQQEIAAITTDTGTYIGQGYLHHNTYGNRMADHHNAQDGSVRRSYTHDIGRKLHHDNSGVLHWGDRYRAFHEDAWREATGVLKPGGIFILNCKNHIRKGEEQPVTEWHVNCIIDMMDAPRARWIEVNTPGMRYGANPQRLQEWVVVIEKPLVRGPEVASTN